MEPLTKDEIAEIESKLDDVFSKGSVLSYNSGQSMFNRLCYTAMIGAEFIKQTKDAKCAESNRP